VSNRPRRRIVPKVWSNLLGLSVTIQFIPANHRYRIRVLAMSKGTSKTTRSALPIALPVNLLAVRSEFGTVKRSVYRKKIKTRNPRTVAMMVLRLLLRTDSIPVSRSATFPKIFPARNRQRTRTNLNMAKKVEERHPMHHSPPDLLVVPHRQHQPRPALRFRPRSLLSILRSTRRKIRRLTRQSSYLRNQNQRSRRLSLNLRNHSSLMTRINRELAAMEVEMEVLAMEVQAMEAAAGMVAGTVEPTVALPEKNQPRNLRTA
jgi:hypothetical protein